jgi:hypothetical protein
MYNYADVILTRTSDCSPLTKYTFTNMKPSVSVFILFQLVALIKQIVGQGERAMNHNNHAFWALQDDMENWTAREWDEWWEELEAQFAMQDQDFPEWTEQNKPSRTSKQPGYPSSGVEATGNLRGSRKNGGRGK